MAGRFNPPKRRFNLKSDWGKTPINWESDFAQDFDIAWQIDHRISFEILSQTVTVTTHKEISWKSEVMIAFTDANFPNTWTRKYRSRNFVDERWNPNRLKGFTLTKSMRRNAGKYWFVLKYLQPSEETCSCQSNIHRSFPPRTESESIPVMNTRRRLSAPFVSIENQSRIEQIISSDLHDWKLKFLLKNLTLPWKWDWSQWFALRKTPFKKTPFKKVQQGSEIQIRRIIRHQWTIPSQIEMPMIHKRSCSKLRVWSNHAQK
jgi:hypothetical protein